MKRRIRTSWPSLTVIGVVAATLPAYGETTRQEFSFVQAFFESIDETQCVATGVFVTAVDAESVSVFPPGPPESFGPEGEAHVEIFHLDRCTSTQLVELFCFTLLADGELQFSGPKLDFATLNTTLDCFDILSGEEIEDAISVSLGWVGVGDARREHFHFHFQDGNFDILINTIGKNTFRFAEASGSVSDGLTNFTPDPTAEAFMSLQRSKDVTIFR